MWKEFLLNPSESEDSDSDAGMAEDLIFSDENLIDLDQFPPTKEMIEKTKTHGLLRCTKALENLDKALETLITGKVVYVDLMVGYLADEGLNELAVSFQKSRNIQFNLKVLTLTNFDSKQKLSKRLLSSFRKLDNLVTLTLDCFFNASECLLLCKSIKFRKKFSLFLDEATLRNQKVARNLCFSMNFNNLNSLGMPSIDDKFSEATLIKLSKNLGEINGDGREFYFIFSVSEVDYAGAEETENGRKAVDSNLCKSNFVCHPSIDFGESFYVDVIESISFYEPLVLSSKGRDYILPRFLCQEKYMKT